MTVKIKYIDNDYFHFDLGTKQQITNTVKSNELQLRKLLPRLSSSLTLTIIPSQEVIPELGKVGYALSPNKIEFKYDPKSPIGLGNILGKGLCSTLFHEAHHATRMLNVKWGGDLVERSIFEGLAVVFERDSCGNNPILGQYDPDVINVWFKELIQNKFDKNKKHWLFEHPDGRKWIGYKVGAYIVDQAAVNTTETSATLVSATADDILKMAKLEY